MKRLFVCMGFLLAVTTVLAQSGQPKMPPVSPPEKESATISGTTITITYSSPRVNGRAGKIFTPDGLIKQTHKSYPVWRGGANSATTLVTSGDIMIGDLMIPAGTYTLFVDISDPAKWVFIVSKATGEWGLSYDPTKDLGRTPMTMSKPPALVEDLKYTLADSGGGNGTLTLAWENMSASVPIMIH
jgi:hypothetical protein